MAEIRLKKFFGEIPREEPHLLPDGAAQLAVDCDLSGGALRPIENGLLFKTVSSSPARGIYTEDGINFYTWTAETFAFQSPVIDDTRGRIYHLTPGVGLFKASLKSGMTTLGPTPAAGSTWNVGVPRPLTAPGLAAINRTTLPDYPTALVTGETWYEDSAGKTYDRATRSLTTITALRRYSMPKPTMPTEAQGEAEKTYRLVAKLTFINFGTEILSATIKPGVATRSSALPGGVEFTLDDSGSAAVVNLSWGIAETRAYVYVHQNTWGEEGAPSPAAVISVNYIQDVQITFELGAAAFAGYRPHEITKIYRTFGTNSSYIEADYTYTGNQIGVDTSRKPKVGGKALESTNWTPPPTGLQGIELTPNGWFAAFKGNTLYMSEPYRPHAWPYNLTFPKNIRGIKVGQQALVVTTVEGVYIVAGATPSAAQQMNLNLPQAGISQGSMVNVDGGVVYAANDGFVMVSGSSADISSSQKLFDRNSWRAMVGSQLSGATMKMAYHDGSLIAVGTATVPSGQAQGFLLKLDENAGSFTRLSTRFDAMFRLQVNDALYYSVGSTIYQFRASGAKRFDWHSKDYIFSAPVGFGAGAIRCDGAVTLIIYADGLEVYRATTLQMFVNNTAVTSSPIRMAYFRLPPIGRFIRWSVRLQSTAPIHEFAIAGSMDELKRG